MRSCCRVRLKAALVPWFARVPRRTGFRGEWRYGLLNDVRSLDPRLDQTVKRFVALGQPRGAEPPGALPPALRPRLASDPHNLERLRDAHRLRRKRVPRRLDAGRRVRSRETLASGAHYGALAAALAQCRRRTSSCSAPRKSERSATRSWPARRDRARPQPVRRHVARGRRRSLGRGGGRRQQRLGLAARRRGRRRARRRDLRLVVAGFHAAVDRLRPPSSRSRSSAARASRATARSSTCAVSTTWRPRPCCARSSPCARSARSAAQAESRR